MHAPRPAWGSPEWHEEMAAGARRMFTRGDGYAGRDFDREREIENGDDYMVTPKQFGSGSRV